MSRVDLHEPAAVSSPAGVRPAGLRSRRATIDRDALTPYLFVSPFVLIFLVFFIGPAGYSLVLSFFRYRGFGTATFVGLQNYARLLGYHVFWTTLGNSVFYWLAHAIPMLSISFMLAVLVMSRNVREAHRRVFKPIIFLPQLVAATAGALVFQNFFATRNGVLNLILGRQIPWLEDMTLARWAVVILMIWRGAGYWFIIFLANLTSISDEIYDAARVDGASPRQTLFRITIPLMRNAFLFAFLVDAIVSLRLYAEPNILGGRAGALAPVGMAPVLNTVVENISGGRFGVASAAGWLIFIVVLLVTGVQYLVLGDRRKGGRS